MVARAVAVVVVLRRRRTPLRQGRRVAVVQVFRPLRHQVVHPVGVRQVVARPLHRVRPEDLVPVRGRLQGAVRRLLERNRTVVSARRWERLLQELVEQFLVVQR